MTSSQMLSVAKSNFSVLSNGINIKLIKLRRRNMYYYNITTIQARQNINIESQLAFYIQRLLTDNTSSGIIQLNNMIKKEAIVIDINRLRQIHNLSDIDIKWFTGVYVSFDILSYILHEIDDTFTNLFKFSVRVSNLIQNNTNSVILSRMRDMQFGVIHNARRMDELEKRIEEYHYNFYISNSEAAARIDTRLREAALPAAMSIDKNQRNCSEADTSDSEPVR